VLTLDARRKRAEHIRRRVCRPTFDRRGINLRDGIARQRLRVVLLSTPDRAELDLVTHAGETLPSVG